MVARVPEEERGAELVISGSGDGQEVGIAIGDRRRVVDVAGRTGAQAARIVALAVTDLVEETLPAPLPRAATVPPITMSLQLGAAKGIRESQPWSTTVDVGASMPYGSWLRLAAELGWTHALDASTFDTHIVFDTLALRLGAGGKLGPLEVYLGPWITLFSIRGSHDKTNVLFGGRVWSRLVVPIAGPVSLSVQIGLDLAANDFAILLNETEVTFSTPRVGVAGSLGVSVDIDR
jgi:hypothetical protein